MTRTEQQQKRDIERWQEIHLFTAGERSTAIAEDGHTAIAKTKAAVGREGTHSHTHAQHTHTCLHDASGGIPEAARNDVIMQKPVRVSLVQSALSSNTTQRQCKHAYVL